MDTATLQRIRDVFDKADSIGIVVGRGASIDDMAAALSLYLASTQINKKVSIASASEPLVEHSSLVGINKVKPTLEGTSGGGDLVVSFPYREGEIEKVSYTIEGGYLNIVVKAGEQGLTFDERDVRFSRGGTSWGAPKMLFVVGTPRLSDLGNLFDPEALKDSTIVNIDNRRENQGFGDMVVVSDKASSVSELMANIILYLALEIDVDCAQNLLNGIIAATDSFQSPSTSPLAFEMAGILMKYGAKRRPSPQYSRNEERPQVSAFKPEIATSTPPFMPQQTYPRTTRGVGVRGTQDRNIQDIRDDLRSVRDTRSAQAPQDNKKPPADWLSPKVYHGSDKVE